MKRILLFALALICSVPLLIAQDGTITTRVWNDLDGDGKQDGGSENSANLENITVKLLLSNNSVVSTTTTNASGVAMFTEPAGTYKLQFVLPPDHAFTKKDAAGVGETQDSDANLSNGRTGTFSLTAGGSITTVDAGMWAPGTIEARVWNDLDGDGKQDGGSETSANLSGITVKLLEANNSLITSTTTASNGVATFVKVPANRPVKLEYVLPADHAFTPKDAASDNQDSDANLSNGRTATFEADRGNDLHNTIDAGMWAPGTVQARVWNDLDGDGKQDGGSENSANLSGITVKLLEANNSPIAGATAITDGNGIATILNVPADRPVKLEYVLPADHAFTPKDAASDDQDSDADLSNGRTASFQADRGNDLHNTIDAGMWAPGTVQARVWNDLDGDGKQDGGSETSANLSGITVKLLEANNSSLATTTTNANGVATFNDVPADRALKLQFIRPLNHAITPKDAASDDQDSDADLSNGRTATFQADRGNDLHNTIDAGLWTPGTVTARVWDDLDGDGKQDGGSETSANLSGITVKLLEANNSLISSAVTNSSGIATIPNVPADRFVKLQYVLPTDHAFTPKDAPGVNDTQDSDADLNNGRTATFKADRGADLHTHNDAGMWTPGIAKARVWMDLDGDGKQDGGAESSGNSNVFGMRVNLLNANNSPVMHNGQPVFGITDCGTGVATLDYVPADRPVKLQFIKFTNGVFTTKDAASDSQDSDADLNNGRTTTFSADRGSDEHTTFDAGLTSRGDWDDASVIARVWNDLDGDGKQDGSESGSNIENAKVRLLDTDGNTCYCEKTNSSGIATLPAIGGETYRLKFDLLADHKFTPDNVGNNDGIDSDAQDSAGNPANLGRTPTFTITAGQTISNLDAGMWAPGSAVVRVWNDLDGDGKQDGSESGSNVAGVMVKVWETGGTLLINPNTNAPVTAVTDANGEATLNYVPADRPFRLKFDLLTDHKFTPDNVGNNEGIDSDAQDSAGNPANLGQTPTYSASKGSHKFEQIDAGLWAPGSALVRVWNDIDGDGKQDGSESGNNIEGATVKVRESGGAPLINPNTGLQVMGTTNSSGIATIPYLPADRPFRLKFDLLTDHKFTPDNIGNNEGIDSDAQDVAGNLNNLGQTPTYSASKGSQMFEQIDAGMWAPGSAIVRVWNDLDGDGKQDGSESGNNIEGVTVKVREAGGASLINPITNAPVTAVTDINGEATLDYLPADRPFRLKFDLLTDHKFTPDNVGNNEGIDSDAQDSAGNPANLGQTPTYSASKGSQEFKQIDAGMWAPGSALVRVWNDLDGDGKQDGSESASNIEGVTVKVRESGGAPLLNPNTGLQVVGTTNSSGVATIPYLPADRPFRLKFDLLTDHKFTPDNVGNNEGIDSDAQDVAGNLANLGQTPTYSASEGSQLFKQIDAGMWAPGKAIARVWMDSDGDGKQDGSESSGNNNVFGMRVNLLNADNSPVLHNGQPVFGITECGTGEATLDYVPADRPVRLEFVKFTNGVFTTKDAGNNNSIDSDADTGNGRTTTFSADRGSDTHTTFDAGLTARGDWDDAGITTYVWDDKNGDGKQNDGGGAGISNVKVTLTDKSGTFCYCDDTGANGQVSLPAIGGNEYRLKYDVPTDHKITLQNQGSNDGVDSDPNPGTGITHKFSMAAGQNRTDVDAGMWAPGIVKTFVWNDKNGDGKQNDGGGSGLENVEVKLTESNGTTVLATETTGSNGIATFTGVPADRELRLVYTTPADHKLTLQNQGSNDGVDSDANVGTGWTHKFKATKGSHLREDVDAGMWAPGTVKTFVWNDKNGDGKQNDGGGSGLENVEVKLTESNGTTVLATETTGSNGIATFTGVPADRELRLVYTTPADHKLTLQNQGSNEGVDSDANVGTGWTHKFKATKGSHLRKDVDAGMWAPGTVKTFVWDDKNGDGKQNDGGGSALGSIEVKLTESDGTTVLATQTTGSNGIATFTGVPADRELRLVYTVPANHKLTQQNQGSNDNVDSDPNAGTGISHKFKATKGSHLREDVDAGMWAPGSLVTYVWDDKNGDGKQNDGGGSGLENVEVKLTESNGTTVLATGVTNLNGFATFFNVPADRELRLVYTVPADHKLTQQNQGSNDGVDSDPNAGTGVSHKFKATKGSHLREDVDAGMWAPGTVKTFVWDDKNGDGKQNDGGGSALEGVEVSLTESNGSTIIATTTTNANGIATFTDVPADRELRLLYSSFAGYELTQQNQGSNDGVDSDPNAGTGLTHKFKATKGSHLREDVDAGMVETDGGGLRLAGSSSDDEKALLIEFTMYPVPAYTVLNVLVESNENVDAQYRVVDVTGKLMIQNDVLLTEGETSIRIPVEQIVGGTYLFQVITKDEVITKPFTIVRD